MSDIEKFTATLIVMVLVYFAIKGIWSGESSEVGRSKEEKKQLGEQARKFGEERRAAEKAKIKLAVEEVLSERGLIPKKREEG